MASVLGNIWEWFFGCRHRQLSMAFTNGGETYKVCLNCGKRLPYSWKTMSIVRKKGNGIKRVNYPS
jgi:hypothetical protein